MLAWRNLGRQKMFAFINILGLSMGITCCLVISIFVRYELGFDQYHSKADHIYKVVQETKFAEGKKYWSTTAYPLAEAIRNDFSGVWMVTQAAGPVPRMFRVEDKSGNVFRFEEEYVLFVDPYYPKVFDFKWLQGNEATAFTITESVVLTESLARKYFGKEMSSKESILGRQMMLNNKDELTITGVVSDAPGNTSLKYNLLIPYEFFRKHNTYSAGNWSGNYQGSTFVTFTEEQSPEKFEKQIATWKKKYLKPEDDNRIEYKLQPLAAMHTDSKYGSSPRSYVMPLKMIYSATGVGLFILAIACVNFINLATAQAANRAKEVGIRKVMGSSTPGLIAQFLTENILLVSITLIFSIAIAQFALDGINQMLSIITLKLVFDWTSLLMVLIIGVLVVAFACVYPTTVMSSFRPVESLKSKFNSKTGGLSLRRTLIVFQFAIVQLFIIATLVVGAQMNFFKNADMGFSREDPVIAMTMNDPSKAEIFRQQLFTSPAIKDVTFSSSSAMAEYNHNLGTSFRLPGQSEEEGIGAEEKGVDLNYISFFGLELIAGRNFNNLEGTFTELIVNEKVCKALGRTPSQLLGQRLIINEGEGTVVGIIRDFHNKPLKGEISPCIFLNSSWWLERVNVKFHSKANMPEALAFVENQWKQLYPEGVYMYSFLDESIAQNYALEQLAYRGFTVFSILTTVIGCLGLYGLLSFITLRKTKEVGIRKALGASVGQIVAMFNKEFIILVVVAFVIAAPLAFYFMNQWLQTFTYRISLSWWMFGLGAGLTIVITLVTISHRSVSAAMANPVDSLRNE
jgi:ABC-type antimicrobial peptide transport system permease subunit